MILEVAVLTIRSGQEADFESAMKAARPLIAATPGFRALELRRCIEAPSRYLLLVDWDSVESHEIGFRKSDRYREWRLLLHHFYEPMPNVEHYGSDLMESTSPRVNEPRTGRDG